MKIYLSQINTRVGDLDGNCAKILEEFNKASAQNADLAAFCEMSLTGYPCEDLWLRKDFLQKTSIKITEVIEATKSSKCAILFGAPYVEIDKAKREVVYNAAFLVENGEIKNIIKKKSLPNYGVFDENRYFAPSPLLSYVEFREQTLAILICEDLWDAKNIYLMQEQIFDAVVVINASPYEIDKAKRRVDLAKNIVSKIKKPLIYINQIGGQDALVFDGRSFVLNENGEEILRLKEFEEDFAFVNLKKGEALTDLGTHQNLSLIVNEEELYSACVLGLRDYVHKTNHQKVLLGMSGGIDSAVVAMMAVDAFGSQNVSLFALPSRFNSEASMKDALDTAKNLGVKLEVISIEETFNAMLKTLENQEISALAKENMQARIRGNILMALANSGRGLLLSTGNKSEMSVGYATIYGDMCGAFNPLKDLYKTQIYKIVKWRNENIAKISLYQKTNLIAQNILTKEPTAELRENQKDSDSLPPYEILDKILYQMIEKQNSSENIIKMGYEKNMVDKIAKLVKISEHKRRQAVIGPKVSELSFDRDRRYPIVNGFDG